MWIINKLNLKNITLSMGKSLKYVEIGNFIIPK